MNLKELIQIRDALAIAKDYANNNDGKRVAPVDVYMPIVRAWSLASAIVTVKAEKVEVEIEGVPV